MSLSVVVPFLFALFSFLGEYLFGLLLCGEKFRFIVYVPVFW